MDLAKDYGAYWKNLTPLMVAAGSAEGATVETLRWLMAHGADLNAVSGAGVTAAWYAAGSGFAEVSGRSARTTDQAERLCFLLDAGLSGTAAEPVSGIPLLIQACQVGDPARVKLLLEAGASVHPRTDAARPEYSWDEDNPWQNQPWPFEIPVFSAAESGSVECVELILAAGADPNMRDYSGATPVMQARNLATFQRLVAAGADPMTVDRYGKDALYSFISRPMAESGFSLADMQRVVATGMDVNALVKYDSWTRLYVAAFDRNVAAIEWLLVLGADITLGRPPLSGLCWHSGSSDCEETIQGMELLIAAGCDVNARDAAGDTLLHNATLDYSHSMDEACFNSSSDGLNAAAALTLLKHGADPDPVGSRGFTPLMNAAQSGSAVAVAALLEAGADPSRRNDKGLTAGDIVMAQIGLLGQQQNNPEMTGELRAYYEQGYQDAIACGRLLGLPTDS